MRFEAVRAIYENGLKNNSLWFINGDLGHMKTEEFRRDFGARYINGGMSEQNIIGVSAGLALSGMQVVAYSIVPFITLRCIEQIKIDICDQNLNVIVLGVGGGFAYGSAGATHYSIEELAMLRALPNMKIVCPADPPETYSLMKQVLELGGPAYVRIGRGKEPNLPVQIPAALGKASVLREGGDITIVSQGTIVSEALRAAEILSAEGLEVEVANMHTLKPIDREFLLDRAGKRRGIFTLEEHSVIGGLGSAVAEVLMDSDNRPKKFHSFGVDDFWPETVGSQQYLRDVCNISAEKVAGSISRILAA